MPSKATKAARRGKHVEVVPKPPRTRGLAKDAVSIDGVDTLAPTPPAGANAADEVEVVDTDAMAAVSLVDARKAELRALPTIREQSSRAAVVQEMDIYITALASGIG